MSLRKSKIDVNRVFQALSDPTRREILERIGRGPVSVSHLAEPLQISLAAVVQHLQVLEDSGLVHTEKVGRVRTCRLDPAGLAASQLRQQETLRRCCSIGQEIAQFTVDLHPCDNHPEAQEHCKNPEGPDSISLSHRPVLQRSVMTVRSPSGERMAIVKMRPSEPVKRT